MDTGSNKSNRRHGRNIFEVVVGRRQDNQSTKIVIERQPRGKRRPYQL